MAQIGPSLDENVRYVKEALGYSNDIVIRELVLDSREPVRAAVVYTDGMVDTHMVQGVLINSLLYKTRFKELELEREEELVPFLKDAVLTVGDIGDVDNFPEMFTAMLSGCAILFLDGYEQAMAIGLQEWKDRGVTEPTAQTVIRGPREGFTENLRTNVTLLRRRIVSEKMWGETRRIGEVTKTEIAVVYIKGLVEEGVVEEVRSRLDRIDMDGIMESGMIEELIQDAAYTPFPTISNSERPDVVASNLLEGRVAILVDGTPFVLTVPSLFVEFFHSAEDYYQRADFSTLIRMLRFICFFIALLAPSLYIAITTLTAHQSGGATGGRAFSGFRGGGIDGDRLRDFAGGGDSHAARCRAGNLHCRDAGNRPGRSRGGYRVCGDGYRRFDYGDLQLYFSGDQHVDSRAHPALSADGAGGLLRHLRHHCRGARSGAALVQPAFVWRSVHEHVCSVFIQGAAGYDPAPSPLGLGQAA